MRQLLKVTLQPRGRTGIQAQAIWLESGLLTVILSPHEGRCLLCLLFRSQFREEVGTYILIIIRDYDKGDRRISEGD